MSQEHLGRCFICKRMEGDGHEVTCTEWQEECSECGSAFPDKHFNCFEHLESTEDLRGYALGTINELGRVRESAIAFEKIATDAQQACRELLDLMNRLTADSLGIRRSK